MPFAFLSPEDKDRISFVNPAGVDLLAYEKKVGIGHLNTYHLHDMSFGKLGQLSGES